MPTINIQELSEKENNLGYFLANINYFNKQGLSAQVVGAFYYGFKQQEDGKYVFSIAINTKGKDHAVKKLEEMGLDFQGVRVRAGAKLIDVIFNENGELTDPKPRNVTNQIETLTKDLNNFLGNFYGRIYPEEINQVFNDFVAKNIRKTSEERTIEEERELQTTPFVTARQNFGTKLQVKRQFFDLFSRIQTGRSDQEKIAALQNLKDVFARLGATKDDVEKKLKGDAENPGLGFGEVDGLKLVLDIYSNIAFLNNTLEINEALLKVAVSTVNTTLKTESARSNLLKLKDPEAQAFQRGLSEGPQGLTQAGGPTGRTHVGGAAGEVTARPIVRSSRLTGRAMGTLPENEEGPRRSPLNASTNLFGSPAAASRTGAAAAPAAENLEARLAALRSDSAQPTRREMTGLSFAAATETRHRTVVAASAAAPSTGTSEFGDYELSDDEDTYSPHTRGHEGTTFHHLPQGTPSVWGPSFGSDNLTEASFQPIEDSQLSGRFDTRRTAIRPTSNSEALNFGWSPQRGSLSRIETAGSTIVENSGYYAEDPSEFNHLTQRTPADLNSSFGSDSLAATETRHRTVAAEPAAAAKPPTQRTLPNRPAATTQRTSAALLQQQQDQGRGGGGNG